MAEILGTFEGREYAYRCAGCLTVMVLKDAGGSYCPGCDTLGGGFYLPVNGAPETVAVDLSRALRVTARRGWRWRWPLGDLLEWDWLLRRV